MLCSKCQKNIAIVFVTKLEGDKQTNEGLCLACAKELGIAPIDEFMGQMGLDDSDLEAMNDEINELMDDFESGDMAEQFEVDAEDGSPMGIIGKMFSRFPMINREPKEENPQLPKGGEGKSAKTATKEPKKPGKKKVLDIYGCNLNRKAEDGLVDRVIGRDKEIDRVIQILNRRTKNNPVLLGEPGVGKTAIAEGLAVRICQKQVPQKLLGYDIYLLDFTALVAGTQFRGQFEARLKNVIEEAKSLGNVILVIDELHNIVGAGDAEGAMSAANILKPALARGEIQVIGATTLGEYRKHIEKDTALERRFQTVIVEEASVADSVEILEGIKDYYEKYHHVTISREVIEAAVTLSERYVTERFLPDKAIDIIDEAGSRANLKNAALVKLAELNEELVELQRQKEEAVATDSISDYKKAAELKVAEFRLSESIEKAKAECEEIAITFADVASIVEAWTGVPIQRITELESERLINLEERIHNRIVGQNEAVESVSRAIRRRRIGISKKQRPVSFIFVGPTGVGKTELVKALAEVVFDNEEAVIRLDMSEYSEPHSISKLIGSPPGYVGYDDAGQLTEKVRRKPYSIILLDEIEKAHHEVFNILLQILDDGRISDSHGKVVNFSNTIIIMTSNAGSDLKSGSLGFINDENEAIGSKVQSALKNIFRPEFLNRIDEVVVFKQLEKQQLLSIVDIMLRDMTEELADKGIVLTVAQAAKEEIVRRGYDPKYGARPIRRVIQNEVEDMIAHKLIYGGIQAGDTVDVDVADGEFVARNLK